MTQLFLLHQIICWSLWSPSLQLGGFPAALVTQTAQRLRYSLWSPWSRCFHTKPGRVTERKNPAAREKLPPMALFGREYGTHRLEKTWRKRQHHAENTSPRGKKMVPRCPQPGSGMLLFVSSLTAPSPTAQPYKSPEMTLVTLVTSPSPSSQPTHHHETLQIQKLPALPGPRFGQGGLGIFGVEAIAHAPVCFCAQAEVRLVA